MQVHVHCVVWENINQTLGQQNVYHALVDRIVIFKGQLLVRFVLLEVDQTQILLHVQNALKDISHQLRGVKHVVLVHQELIQIH